MVCFTFAACGGSDDDDPGVHILLRRFNQIQQAVWGRGIVSNRLITDNMVILALTINVSGSQTIFLINPEAIITNQ